MKVIFLGTPDFGVPALQNILNSPRHSLLAVVCQPDKAGSRGKVSYCAVKKFALEHGIPCLQYASVSREGLEEIAALSPDIMVTAAFGQILSDKFIALAPHGVINIHGSLLPSLRGAAPIQYAVLKGMKQTGITILNTVQKVDAGEIIMQQSMEIGSEETSGQLFERMAQLGGKLIVEALDAIEGGAATYTPQDENLATYSAKITSESERVDWTKSADEVHNLIRALAPTPVAWTTLYGKRLKIHSAAIAEGSGRPGEVISVNKAGFTVACGSGAISVVTLQPENSRVMTAKDFVNGRKISLGDVLA